MRNRLLPVLMISLMLWLGISEIIRPQTQEMWHWTEYGMFAWPYFERQPIVVVGEVTDIQEPEGVVVYHDNGISGVRIYRIQLTEVLKGSGIGLPSEISVCILPMFPDTEPINAAREREAFEQFRKSGRITSILPKHHEDYPQLPVRQPRVFFLYPVDFKHPTDKVLWLGISDLAAGHNFYGYETSFPLSDNGIEAEIIKRYLQIIAVPDTAQRLQQLIAYSMELIQNRQLPLDDMVGTIRGLAGWYKVNDGTQTVWHVLEENLTAHQLHELIQIAADSSRPSRVRMAVVQLLNPQGLRQLANRVIPKQPFINILMNHSENLEVRQQTMFLLEQLGGSDVRRLFEELAQEEPTSDEEKYFLNRLRESKLLKAPH